MENHLKVARRFISIFASDIFPLLEDECLRARWANRIEFKTVEVFVRVQETHKQKGTNEN